MLWYALAAVDLHAQVKRIVILKLDGVPENVLERELARIDPTTHKSTLPWIDHVFAEGGTRLENFYVRSISLSTPSWSILDTGQHLQIHGNAEFDRYTYHVYDYMNFFPFYLGYARSHRVDMPGVEVLDSLGIPLLIDYFPYGASYQSFQLYQRGVRWKTLQDALPHRFSRSLRELLDEWSIGFEIGSSVEDQTERELIARLSDPNVQYLDYFTGDFDHTAHATSDVASQRLALQRIDALVGRVWTAIQASPLAAETVLAAVSDHGMNTEPGIYSQGYSLLQFFGSRAGGGHHVVTDRHPLDEFKLSGLDPFVSEVVTPSNDSLYLKGQADDYPTVLLDPDGNERASVYLRNSNFNTLQILLQAINRAGVNPALRRAAIAAFFKIIDRHRDLWSDEVRDISAELGALHRAIEQRRVVVQKQPKKWTPAQHDAGLDKAARRLAVELESWREQERDYREYLRCLSGLLDLEPAEFDRHHVTAADLIPKRAMGDANSIYDLENYVAGPAAGGLVLTPGGSLDLARSFERIDYPPLLASLSVRNNVQPGVSSHPIDFIAMRVPERAFHFPPGDVPAQDPIWLYSDENHQALILARRGALRYLAVRSLHQDDIGIIQFEAAPPGPGFPLHLFEDKNLRVAPADREQWFSSWHSELDWLRATHLTNYSDGVIALNEQFLEPGPLGAATSDAELLARFNQRRRQLAQPDFLIFANDHWNFNIRNFNPGGNHGSMLRASTHAILLFAGGADTGVPQHLEVQEPYDSLSFVPTILELMGRHADAAKLPGRPIREILPAQSASTSKATGAACRGRYPAPCG
ncbi:MAG TPA: alkaline phosphatase family protein [Bryobacteraceae bacterium]|nr:alkaline phosphatase family protein [Bryobacteraceae bacterium]